MPDTTIRIDRDTRDRLAALANGCGMTLKRLLWVLSRNVKWDDVTVWNGEEIAKAQKRRKAQPRRPGKVIALPAEHRPSHIDRTLTRKAGAPRPPK